MVAVGDQSDGVTRVGNQREKRLKNKRETTRRGQHGGDCRVCGAPADEACARRPTPQTPRDAMLDSDVSSDVLVCVLVMLHVLIYLRGCSDG